MSPVNEEYGLVKEAIVDPDLRIVDCHFHAWPDTFSAITDHYGHASPSSMLDTIAQSGHNVVRGVHVTTGANYDEHLPDHLKPVAETIYLEGEITELGQNGDHLISAIIGSADLQLGDNIQAVLDGHQEASSRFKGIRDSVAWHSSPAIAYKARNGLLMTSEALTAARHLADRDLLLEVWIYYTQMADVINLAKMVPGLKIVLNHLGTPVLDPKVTNDTSCMLAEWKESLRHLSRFENISLKAGGLLMPAAVGEGWADEHPQSSWEDIAAWQQPIFETAIELFTPSRTMFESNHPIDAASYRTIWNVLKSIGGLYNRDEKVQMFETNALGVYGLSDHDSS
ncbi:MAG: hypothetical protein EOP69_00995 [Spirochaetia bacterium]|nr:MAG: hypothetical protein EOP69_00995 [Spirochaetia bacterium]